jgi:hypothetical protein
VTVRICARCRWASGAVRYGASCRRVGGDRRGGVGRVPGLRAVRIDARARISRGLSPSAWLIPYGPHSHAMAENQEPRL